MDGYNRIYLDYNATTPVDPSVIEAMMPYWAQRMGNAASRNHPFGWEAKAAADQARQAIADYLGVTTKELVITSGATESINLAIKGVADRYREKGNHIISVATEHQAVLDTCQFLEKRGMDVTYLKVNSLGLVDLQELERSIRPETVLVSVMWANNETGLLQPIKAIGDICAKHQVLFFSDATQAVGKIEVRPKEVGVHLLAFSAHKCYGPKGVGALFVNGENPKVYLTPQIHGGGHEERFRSGTLNVPGLIGLGKALAIAQQVAKTEEQRLRKLRDRLEEGLLNQLDKIHINGDPQNRLAHVSNITFRFVEAEALMNTFNQRIAASTGSACSSASLEPSHVLLAMGLDARDAQSTVRFSLGRLTTAEEIEEAIQLVVAGVHKMRRESPVWQLFQQGLIE